MPFLPSAENILPETFGALFMPAPTAETTEILLSLSILSIAPSFNSSENSSLRFSTSLRASSLLTAKQMFCSEEDCEIINTLLFVRAAHLNTRSAIPGIPSIPLPLMLISAVPLIRVIAFTNPFCSSFSVMSVPGKSG